jgi:thiamine-phosphate pyrophosphorylase
MDSEWTPAVARAVHAAQRFAFYSNAAETIPMHLFLGLVEEEEGKAAQLLTAAGLSLDHVRRPLLSGPEASLPPLGVAARAVLTHANSLARELEGEAIVSGPAVVLALLRCDEDLRRLLESEGLDFGRLERTFHSEGEPPLEHHEPLQLSEPTDQIDAARVLDANFNRAREALRVVEDYCRFVLDDAFLSGELKRTRHELSAALETVPLSRRLESRETLRDVGTAISIAREETRSSPLEVAQVNFKRLQEALRSLEEFGKLHDPGLGRQLQGLRYRVYTLERAVILGVASRRRLDDARLYVLVTGSLCAAALDWTIAEAAAGGASMIQLREKELDDRRLLERAREVRRWTTRAGVLFILNDRPDLARLAGADGVHLGQGDLPVKEARRILGPGALIGVSTRNLEQVRQAIVDGADYIAVGPAFPSTTKPFDEIPGLEFVRQALGETSLPAFVIGGVNQETIDDAVASGAQRVAVSAAICASDDPRAVAAELSRRVNSRARKD